MILTKDLKISSDKEIKYLKKIDSRKSWTENEMKSDLKQGKEKKEENDQ